MSIITPKHDLEDDCPCAECLRSQITWRSGGAKFRMACVLVITAVLLLAAAARADAGIRAPRSNPRCQAYEQAMLSAGASAGVADRMAYVIAPRESGCTMACVHDSDDHSCSYVGLNGKGRLAATWIAWCGVDVRKRHSMYADARCAKIAHDKMGWRPWR